MTYAFTPMPDVSGDECHHAFWKNGFTSQELDQIIEIGEVKAEDEGIRAVVGSGDESAENGDMRRSDVVWLRSEDCPWLFDRMAWIARQLNARFFNFDLYGFCEAFQYTTYRGEDGAGGHYDWHIDRGGSAASGMPPRKLSMVLMLSDPTDYVGGELQIQAGAGQEILEPTRGIVHVFPSWVLHRVTPVTEGLRRTGVMWTGGPKFR